MTRRAAMTSFILHAAAAAGAGHASDSVPSFTADPAGSHLDFSGVQAGAVFKGTFHKFAATVDFSPDVLSSSHVDVQVDMNSSDTKDNDRDKTMRGPDIYDTARYPTAHYVTRSITKTATGYHAAGELTLHGVTKDVPLEFQFVPAPVATLRGTASLKRLEFGVGQGDWKSTEWVADAVKISFSLALKPKG